MVPKSRSSRRRNIIIAGIAAAVVLAGAGIFYAVSIAPFQKTVMTADGRAVSMDYLLKRTRMAGGNASATLQQLAYEQVVDIAAPSYNIIVSAADIDAKLRQDAASQQGAATDTAFQQWYVARLKATGLSDAQYRDLVATSIKAGKLLDDLGNTIPASTEQVHLYAIEVATLDEAQQLKARILAGENFTALAAASSLDTQTKAKGGEVGWVPRGVTPYDEVVFNLLPGDVSTPELVDPNNPATGGFVIFQVTEKDPNRVIDPASMQTLRSEALYNFVVQQVPLHIKFVMTAAETDWITKQLAKGT